MTSSSKDLEVHAEERLYAYYRRKEEAMKRAPIRPEGPRMTAQPYFPPDPESRAPVSPRRGVARATQSLPERVMPEREYPRERREEYRVSDADEDAVYDYSEDDVYDDAQYNNAKGNVKRLDPAGMTAAKSTRASNLKEHIQRQRFPISPERRRPERKPQNVGARVTYESTPAPVLVRESTPAPAVVVVREEVESSPPPKKEEEAPVKPKKSKRRSSSKGSKKADRYDQFSTQESTSGFSLFSDKYRIIGASKSKNSAATQPHANLEKSVKKEAQGLTGAQLGNGQFNTPVGGVVGFGAATVGGMLIGQEPLVQESCFEDFVHTMILPLPAPPQVAEQEAMTKGMQEMNDAAVATYEVDGCASIIFDKTEEPEDIETIVKKDWYDEKEEQLVQESFVKDFLHTMWSCS